MRGRERPSTAFGFVDDTIACLLVRLPINKVDIVEVDPVLRSRVTNFDMGEVLVFVEEVAEASVRMRRVTGSIHDAGNGIEVSAQHRTVGATEALIGNADGWVG